jgi:hypothetical protein
MRLKGLLFLSFLLCVAIASQAGATVVTFDDAVGNSILNTYFTNGQSFSDQGLTFTNQGSYMGVYSGNPNGNGTNSLVFAGFNTGDYLAVTKTGGGTFNLNSLDMSISWYDGNASEVIMINGSPVTLIQGIQTYALNLNGITQLTITGVPSNTGYWLADNINYSAVPLPGAFFLFGPGLVGLAAVRRRFKK